MGRLRMLTAGESHGPKIAAIVEGLPAGLVVDFDAIDRELRRRQLGYGRGYRMRGIERDQVGISAGVRFGRTTGAPVLLEVENRDHENWLDVMNAHPQTNPSPAEARALHRPRPGHADLVGALKYGFEDMRDALERASARNTCVRVAAGAIAKSLLSEIGVEVFSMVVKIGGVAFDLPRAADSEELRALAEAAEESDVRCPDPEIAEQMRARIDEAKKSKDTVGGSFVVVATGLPIGLGSYVEWDRKLDGRLAQALMSIQAVKAVEIGIGTENANVFGSEAHDVIRFDESGQGGPTAGYVRPSNRAGGLEGGVTNGQPLLVRGTMKPISTLARPMESVDMRSHELAEAGYERSDVCAVPACAVIAEAAVAFCLAEAALECFSSDTVDAFRVAHRAHLDRMSA